MAKWIKRLSLMLGVLATAVLTGIALDVYRFSLRDETRPADAAIVLGAAVYGERPSPIFRERINHAIRLYQEGHVQHIIFTGGVGHRDELAEAEVGRNYALARGVPATAVLIEITSTNTQENLANAQIVAAENGLTSFLIVSTPYHMRRALAIADDLGMAAYSSPTRTIRWISPLTQTLSFTREVAAYTAYRLGVVTAVATQFRQMAYNGHQTNPEIMVHPLP
ncbi:MAG: YdcF family protein [Anaerolineae bacterium]|nr:YdcF family protein [Anaerolineae bacterium]